MARVSNPKAGEALPRSSASAMRGRYQRPVAATLGRKRPGTSGDDPPRHPDRSVPSSSALPPLADAPPAAFAPPPLRRDHDYRILWLTQMVSAVGSQVSWVAFPLLVLGRGGSPAAAG